VGLSRDDTQAVWRATHTYEGYLIIEDFIVKGEAFEVGHWQPWCQIEALAVFIKLRDETRC
jgi:hypothetical protein